MRLYSRGQVIFFSLLSAFVVVLLALGLGFLKFGPFKTQADNAVLLEVDRQEGEFKLMQSEYIARNTADLVQFSE